VSPDPVDKLAAFAEAEHLTFPLVSDVDRTVLEAYGAWGEKKLYGKTVVGVIRSTVVVDPEGAVELAQYNVKATGHVAKLRRDLGMDPQSPDARSRRAGVRSPRPPGRSVRAGARRSRRRLTPAREWRNWQPRQV